MTEVDPQQRRGARPGDLGAPQQRAVSAEDDDDLAARRPGSRWPRPARCQARADVWPPWPMSGPVSRPRAGGWPPGRPCAGPAGGRRARRAGLCGSSSTGAAPPVVLTPALPRRPPRWRLRRARGRRRAATGSTPRCPPAPAAGEACTPRVPRPSRSAARATASTTSARAAGIAHDPAPTEPLAAHLELRLDHQHQVAVRAGQADQRRQDHGQGDERQVAHDEVHRATDGGRGELTDVAPIAHGDARRRCEATRRAGRSPRRRRSRGRRPRAGGHR